MSTNEFPWLTAFTAASAIALTLMPIPIELVFNKATVMNGAYWQLLTAHLVHGDLAHLVWNALALLIIGYLLERDSRRALLVAMFLGSVTVNLLLLSDYATIQFYCGFSGVLNTLLFVLLWRLWRDLQSPIVTVIAIVCAAKIMIEMAVSDALLTNISWPPYPEAHLAGLIGAAVYVVSSLLLARKSTGCQSWRKEIRRLDPWTS